MNVCKKYISVFLLLVFAWVVLPPSFVHEVFANHEDTECKADHNPAISHLESVHKHCDVFKTNTPLYDAPELVLFEEPFRPFISDVCYRSVEPGTFSFLYDLRPRGPPLS